MYGKKITATSQSNNNDGEKSTTGSNKRKTENTRAADTSKDLNSTEHVSQIDKREICVKVDAVYNNVEGDTHVFKGTCRLCHLILYIENDGKLLSN